VILQNKSKCVRLQKSTTSSQLDVKVPRSIKHQHYLGHRERLRKKFRQNPTNLSDYEILELFLFSLIPYKDTKQIAKELLSTFKTFDKLAMANETSLCKVNGIGKLTAFSINVLGEIFIRRAKQCLTKKNLLNSWDSIIEYCRISDGYKTKESVHVLFLNKKYHLIADEVLLSGTVDETPFYTREILVRALELNAISIVVIHNHPSGSSSPSLADIKQTKELYHAAKLLGITLQDHIIISERSYTSLREHDYLT
jgi:DNA repair protein RadC